MSKQNNINPPVVAIDLGSTQITAMAAQEQPDSTLKIIAVERKEVNVIRRGVIENSSVVAIKVKDVIEKLGLKLGALFIPVFVSLGGHKMKLINFTVNHTLDHSQVVSPQVLERFQQECRAKFEQQNSDTCVLDIIPDSYINEKGEEINDIVGHKTKHIKINYTVIYGQTALKTGVEGCIDRAGHSIDHYALKTDALSTALLNNEEREDGVAIIDLGGETTTLSVYYEGKLRELHVVPLGGRNITKDIEYWEISEEYAEKLKKVKGYAAQEYVERNEEINIPNVEPNQASVRVSTINLAHAIEARLAEILNPIFKKINELPFDIKSGIVLAGGGSMLKGVVEYIETHTQLPVSIGSHREWLTEETPEYLEMPLYSQLIGMLAIGMQFRKEMGEQKPKKEPKVKKTGFVQKFTNYSKEKIDNFFT